MIGRSLMPNLYSFLAVGIMAFAIYGCDANWIGARSAKPAASAIIEPEPQAGGGQTGPAGAGKATSQGQGLSQTYPSGGGTIILGPMPAEARADSPMPSGGAFPVAPGDLPSSLPSPSPASEPSAAGLNPAPAGQSGPNKIEAMTVGGKEVVTSSVLQINSQFITVDDIVRSASQQLGAIPTDAGADAFRKRAAQVITDEVYKQMSEYLVLAEANSRFGDEVKKHIEAEVDKYQQAMVSTTGSGSKKKLQEVLELQGTTLETVMGDYRRRLTVRAFMHEKIAASIRINRQTMWDYYKANPGEFSQPAQVAMQTISIPFRSFLSLPAGGVAGDAEKQLAIQQAREVIDKAQAQLKAGKDFEQVAIAYSKDSKAAQGGLWPLMGEGSFREVAVEKAAFALKQGQVSDIIQTDSGFYLVKAAQVLPGKVTSFEEAQDKIEDTLASRQEHELTDAYFKKLQEGMNVTSYSNFMELAVEKAVEKYYKKQ